MDVCNYFVKKGITPIVANNYASLRYLIVARSLYSVYQQDSAAAIERFNCEPEELANALRPGVKLVEEMIDYKCWYYETAMKAGTTKIHESLPDKERRERPLS